MNENTRKCKLIGFSKFAEKETGVMKLRVVVGIESISENYKGIMVVPAVFLDYTEQLYELLNKALNNECNIEYVTRENIITVKTKIVQLKIVISLKL